MTTSSDTSSNVRRRFSLFGKKADQYIVDGFEIGTIHKEHDIMIPSGCAVAGDIIGETINVQGMVFGNCIAREITIQSGATVWGDMLAQKIVTENGSTVRGRIHTIDESILVELLTSGHPPAVINPQPEMVPPELAQAVEQISSKHPPERYSLLEQLTAELAAARLARFEVEQSFENRLQAISAERINEAETLKNEVDILQRERVANQQKTGELTATLQQIQEANTQARELLDEKEFLIDEQTRELLTLRATEADKIAVRERLEQENRRLADDLIAMTNQAEELANRITSLEAALKASNQRSAEQEQALIHWQELAEINELNAQEAQETLDDVQYSIKQNAQLTENLQQEKERLTAELAAASQEIERLAAAIVQGERAPLLEDQLNQLQEELDRKTKEIDLTKQALVESTAAYTQAAHQIARMEEELQAFKAVGEMRDQWEQRIFDLEDLVELAELKQAKAERQLSAADQSLAHLKIDLNEKNNQAAAFQEKISSLQRTVAAQTNQLVELKSSRDELEKRLEKLVDTAPNDNSDEFQDPNKERLIDKLKKQHGRDIAYLQDQLNAQGQKLAETQVALVEERLKIIELQEKLERSQNTDLHLDPPLKPSEVEELQIELEHKNAQLKDLIRLLERKKHK